ncbi:chromosome segregation protein [Carpediemonas membranifera]|uniref:Chromosome segregation protein n=1 Tax=Carpediemonas membranifera TaxID=201153 RepID=A0A8J6E3S4_9EUKA|nr:chromosome segregation protein [Carpediemonas membranifera]|eukprot:KAG9393562.1 chromosome segregation protein [Carpediemonas membranifera]
MQPSGGQETEMVMPQTTQMQPSRREQQAEDWTVSLPPILRKRLDILQRNVTTLTENFLPLEEHMSTKVAKSDMLTALRSKVERTTFDDKTKELLDAISNLDTTFSDQLGKVSTGLNMVKEQASMLAAQATSTANMSDLFMKLKQDSAHLEQRVQHIHGKVEENDSRYDARFSAAEGETAKSKARLDHVENVAGRIDLKIDGVQKSLVTQLTEQREKLEPGLTRLGTVEAKVRAFTADLDSLMDSAVQKAKVHTTQALNQEIKARSEGDAAITARFNGLDDRMKRLEQMMYELGRTVDAKTTELQHYITDTGAELRAQVGADVDRVTKRMAILDHELSNGLEELHTGAEELEEVKRTVTADMQRLLAELDGVKADSTQLRDDMTTAVRAERQFAEEKALMLDGRISEVSGALEQTAADWQTQWEQRAMDVDDRLDGLKTMTATIDADLTAEKEAREEEVGQVVRAISDLADRMTTDLQAKANWSDVRRSLWLKADKADVPMAVTTRSLGGTHQNKALADPVRPPSELDGTDVLDVGYADPLGHSLTGAGDRATVPGRPQNLTQTLYTPQRTRPAGGAPRRPDQTQPQQRPQTSGQLFLGERKGRIDAAQRAWGSRESWEFT